MFDFEKENNIETTENTILSSKQMYIKEINQYSLLTEEEEKIYGEMLNNKENKKLLVFNDVDGYSVPSLNIKLLFCSLCNNQDYKDIISNLIEFYSGLRSSSDKAITALEEYKKESSIVNRSLNYDEIHDIFSITYNENSEILSGKDLLKEIKEFMNYKLAFEKMFESNLRLVVGIAAKYKCNIDIMDLIQEGNAGLIKAIVGFDVSLGNKFSTYATPCIQQKIRRYITNCNCSVRLPEYIGYELYEFKRDLEKLKQTENRELLLDEIAEKLDLPVNRVRDYLSYMDCDVSLDESIQDSDDLTLGNTIVSDDNVEETVMLKVLRTDIQDLLSILNERSQDIVKMKFGLGEYNGRPHTVYEIGRKYSISPQRAAQIFNKSLYLMKRSIKINGKQKSIADYYYN